MHEGGTASKKKKKIVSACTKRQNIQQLRTDDIAVRLKKYFDTAPCEKQIAKKKKGKGRKESARDFPSDEILTLSPREEIRRTLALIHRDDVFALIGSG